MTEQTGTRAIDARYVLTVAAVAATYFVAAKLGLSLAFATRQVTAVWPPTGIAFVAYLLLGYRVWPGVFLGAFLANATADESMMTAAGIAVGNTLQGLAGVFLLRRFVSFDRSFERLQDVLGVVLFGAIVGGVVSATSGVANLALGGIVPWSAYPKVWWVWWAGDAMGVLLGAPFLLTWTRQPRVQWRGRRLVEILALFAGLGLVCHIALSGAILRTDTLFRLEYAVFPFIIWSALRFGQRETASAVLLVSGVAIWGAVHDRGPFATGTQDQRLILLDAFTAVVAVTALTLGAVTGERQHAEHRLKLANDELEQRVRERTAELSKKNEEVQAFVYIVSHDLRAPLVNLQGFCRELELSCRELQQKLGTARPPVATILEEDIPTSLRYIAAATTKFQRLIDALLLLSRYGRQDYESAEVDVGPLVQSTTDSLRQSIDSSGASVSVGALPRAIGDSTAIGQVFANLIGNALKYAQTGRPGRIEIGGDVVESMAHYWVKDNGAGIPESAQPRLFQVFQRFHPDLAEGEGMGLAIVKRVVERHGGRVWAESREGVGTTFHVTLPAARNTRG